MNELIRLLLEGQLDVQAKALLAPRAFLRGTHDAVPTPGDHHPILLHHETAKLAGEPVFLRIAMRAGAAEDGDFAHAIVFGKNARGVAQLPEGAIE